MTLYSEQDGHQGMQAIGHVGGHAMSILSGMRVVESSAFVAVPLAGMTLAQMGAEVIRVDLIGAGLTWSQFRTVREAVCEDADLSTDNPMFSTVSHQSLSAFPVPSHPATFGAVPRRPAKAAPALGADTEEVLGDVIGLDNREIARLFDGGVVRSPAYDAARAAA